MNEINNLDKTYSQADDLDLIDFIKVIWKGKLLVLCFTGIFAVTSVIISLQIPNKYTSSALLYEVKGNSGTSSGLLANFGGLASMAGIDLPSSAQDKTVLALKIAQSRNFLKQIINYPGLLESIMAVDYYDEEEKKLYFKDNLFDEETGKWKKNNKFNGPNYSPSYQDVYDKKFNKVLSVNHNKKDNYLIISVVHESPIFAEYFLSIIINELDRIIKERDLEESMNAINYLEQKLKENPIREINETLNKLIEENLKTQMLASVQKEYLLRVLDPPFVPERKSSPNRALISFVGTFIGFILGLMFVLFREYFFSSREN